MAKKYEDASITEVAAVDVTDNMEVMVHDPDAVGIAQNRKLKKTEADILWGGGGTQTILTDTVIEAQVAADGETFTFSTIPSGYDELIIDLDGVSTGGEALNSVLNKYELNGDATATNYQYQSIFAGGGLNAQNGGNDNNIGWIGSDANADAANHTLIRFPNYEDTSQDKILDVRIVSKYNDTNLYTGHVTSIWKNTAAITSIHITTNSGAGFVAGATCRLIGRKEVTVAGSGVDTQTIFTGTVLESQTIGLAGDEFSFTSIPTGYDYIEWHFSGHGDSTPATSWLNSLAIEANADTTVANYRRQNQVAHSGIDAITAVDDNVVAFLADNDTAISSSDFIIRCRNYESTIENKIFISHGGSSDSDTIQAVGSIINQWQNTAALTRLDLVEDAGNGFIVGSTCKMIGYKEVTVAGSSAAADRIVFKDVKATTVQGGASVATTWTKRNLQLISDVGGHASIASDTITLAAGTYRIVQGSQPCFQTNEYQSRLRQVTATIATLITGSSTYSDVGANDPSVAVSVLPNEDFVLAAPEDVEFQYIASLVRATNGLGVANAWAGDNLYSILILDKIA